MIRNIVGTALGIAAVGITCEGVPQDGGTQAGMMSLAGEAEFQASTPICLRVNIQPGFDAYEELKLVCPSDIYRGECRGRTKDTSVRMAISGRIRRINESKYLISYNLEVRFADRSGLTRFAAAGSGLFAEGKPRTIVAIAGRSVIMTVTLVERSTDSTSEAREAGLSHAEGVVAKARRRKDD